MQRHYRRMASQYGRRANQTCEATYRQLLGRALAGAGRVLELGAGSSDLLQRVGPRLGVAVDLSEDMLRMRSPHPATIQVAAGGEDLPFRSGTFDAVYHINLLEHVSNPEAVVAESARVLRSQGQLLTITPNGRWEVWLDLAERWKLKIPEGPHVFLTPDRLRRLVERWFAVVEHRTLLVLPAGPRGLAAVVDRLALCRFTGWGFFQYLVARRL